jgi:hypothetical protein
MMQHRAAIGAKERLMNWLTLALGVLSAILGLIAAWRWYKAAEAAKLISAEPTETLRRILRRSGRLNKQAAYWTAATIFVAGLAGLVSAFR